MHAGDTCCPTGTELVKAIKVKNETFIDLFPSFELDFRGDKIQKQTLTLQHEI